MQKNNEINPATGGVHNKIVQTYAEDMAKLIEDDQSGLVKKIIHGEEEHEKEKRNLSPESKKNKFFMIVGVLFIVLGIATLLYFFQKREVPTVPVEQQFTPLIFNDKTTSLDVSGFTKDNIIQAVYNAVGATKVKTGGVEGIYLVNNKKSVGLREFIKLIKGNFVPQSLGDINLVSDNFLLGVVKGDTNDFFMLIKMRSAADIFDSMRSWEKKMFLDLHGFFGLDLTLEKNYLATASFEDGIIENKNARVLYQKGGAQDGEIVMMYIFADDNSVIVTNTKSSAHEIMLRLAASQVKK